jgi:serine/threonine-protein kinase
MPAVVGRPAETVCLQLTALGLKCEQTLQFDDQVAPGAVISSDPVEGTGFNVGDTVRLQVSRGPLVNATVPEVGRRSEEEARMILAEAGFVAITTLAQPSEQVGQGMAIGTTPAAGSSVGIDGPVTILISSGPAPRVTVPDLVGSDRATAESRLGQAGLTATFPTQELPAGDPNVGKVVAVDPGQGTEVLAGTMVTVTIGQQAATTATTATGSSSG